MGDDMPEMRPQPSVDVNGVPNCSYEKCRAYDGKRCELTGFRAGGICEPVVIEMHTAIRSAVPWLEDEGCDCGTDEPGTCALCLSRDVLSYAAPRPSPTREESRSRWSQTLKGDLVEALQSAAATMAFDARDWSEGRRDAWLWGLFCGWDDGAMKEVAAKFRWDEKTVARLKRLNAAVEKAIGPEPRGPTGEPQG